jgi:hypothetical protein
MPKPPFTTEELSAYLWENWRLKRTLRTLQQLRRDGGGPPYHRVGNQILYPRDTVDQWAEAKMGPLNRSTSEESARRLIIPLERRKLR